MPRIGHRARSFKISLVFYNSLYFLVNIFSYLRIHISGYQRSFILLLICVQANSTVFGTAVHYLKKSAPVILNNTQIPLMYMGLLNSLEFAKIQSEKSCCVKAPLVSELILVDWCSYFSIPYVYSLKKPPQEGISARRYCPIFNCYRELFL